MVRRITTVDELKAVPPGTVIYGKLNILGEEHFVGFVPAHSGGTAGKVLQEAFLSAVSGITNRSGNSVRFLHKAVRQNVIPFAVIVDVDSAGELKALAEAVEKEFLGEEKPCESVLSVTLKLIYITAMGKGIKIDDSHSGVLVLRFTRQELAAACPGKPTETPEQMADAFFTLLKTRRLELVDRSQEEKEAAATDDRIMGLR